MDMITYGSDDDLTRKRRFALMRNKKGTPIYSKEDIREQYCINSKEIDALERARKRGLFSCISNRQESPCAKKSILNICLRQRSSSDENLAENGRPSISHRATTWTGNSILHNTSFPEEDTEGGFDHDEYEQSYFRRRPKTIYVPDTKRYTCASDSETYSRPTRSRPKLDILMNTSMDSDDGYIRERLDRPNQLLFKGDNSDDILSDSSHDISGSSLQYRRGVYYYGPETHHFPMRRQVRTPEFILEDRRQKHVSFDSSSLMRSQTVGSFDDSQVKRSMEKSRHGLHQSQERLIDGRKTPDNFDRRFDSVTPMITKALIMEKMKRSSMRTQATQTDGAPITKPEIPPSYLSLSPRLAQRVQMRSISAQTNGDVIKMKSMVKSLSEITHSDNIMMQIYQLDSNGFPIENGHSYYDLSSLPPPLKETHSYPEVPTFENDIEGRLYRQDSREILIDFKPKDGITNGKKHPLVKTLSEGDVLCNRPDPLGYALGYYDLNEEIDSSDDVVIKFADQSDTGQSTPASQSTSKLTYPSPVITEDTGDFFDLESSLKHIDDDEEVDGLIGSEEEDEEFHENINIAELMLKGPHRVDKDGLDSMCYSPDSILSHNSSELDPKPHVPLEYLSPISPGSRVEANHSGESIESHSESQVTVIPKSPHLGDRHALLSDSETGSNMTSNVYSISDLPSSSQATPDRVRPSLGDLATMVDYHQARFMEETNGEIEAIRMSQPCANISSDCEKYLVFGSDKTSSPEQVSEQRSDIYIPPPLPEEKTYISTSKIILMPKSKRRDDSLGAKALSPDSDSSSSHFTERETSKSSVERENSRSSISTSVAMTMHENNSSEQEKDAETRTDTTVRDTNIRDLDDGFRTSVESTSSCMSDKHSQESMPTLIAVSKDGKLHHKEPKSVEFCEPVVRQIVEACPNNDSSSSGSYSVDTNCTVIETKLRHLAGSSNDEEDDTGLETIIRRKKRTKRKDLEHLKKSMKYHDGNKSSEAEGSSERYKRWESHDREKLKTTFKLEFDRKMERSVNQYEHRFDISTIRKSKIKSNINALESGILKGDDKTKKTNNKVEEGILKKDEQRIEPVTQNKVDEEKKNDVKKQEDDDAILNMVRSPGMHEGFSPELYQVERSSPPSDKLCLNDHQAGIVVRRVDPADKYGAKPKKHKQKDKEEKGEDPEESKSHRHKNQGKKTGEKLVPEGDDQISGLSGVVSNRKMKQDHKDSVSDTPQYSSDLIVKLKESSKPEGKKPIMADNIDDDVRDIMDIRLKHKCQKVTSIETAKSHLALSHESLRSVSPGSDNVFLSDSIEEVRPSESGVRQVTNPVKLRELAKQPKSLQESTESAICLANQYYNKRHSVPTIAIETTKRDEAGNNVLCSQCGEKVKRLSDPDHESLSLSALEPTSAPVYSVKKKPPVIVAQTKMMEATEEKRKKDMKVETRKKLPSNLKNISTQEKCKPANDTATCNNDKTDTVAFLPKERIYKKKHRVRSEERPVTFKSQKDIIRAKSEERYPACSINTSSESLTLRSRQSSQGSRRSSSLDISFEDEEETGVYAESYKSSHWVFIGENEELHVWKKVHLSSSEDEELDLKRTGSQGSTTSEREFKRKFQAITHRMVHRKSSVEMYKRLANKTLECDKSITVQRKSGEFGFRIHGSRPVVVSAIEPGTPAEQSGLEVGDIIITINGVNVLDSSHSEVVKIAHSGSENLDLDVARTNDVLTPRVSEEDPSVKTGYLWKLGNLGIGAERDHIDEDNCQWYQRWFCLKPDNCLYFYKSHTKEHPLGAIALQNYSISPVDNVGKEFALKVSRSGSATQFIAMDSQEELTTWYNLLSSAASYSMQTDLWIELSARNIQQPPASFTQADCNGFLSKLGNKWKAWKRRYCVLKDACMYFYNDVSSMTALGVAHLHGYRVQSCSIGGKKHAYELIPPDPKFRHFYFYTDSDTDKKRWLAALEYSIDRWIKAG